ncbi:hypothetical protein ACFV2I_36860 [Streptomyces microflavus]|uniref:hypothetical protein n=1 Tax=Streptomyces microflavus TaxID=1919 RepID=UPI00367374A1
MLAQLFQLRRYRPDRFTCDPRGHAWSRGPCPLLQDVDLPDEDLDEAVQVGDVPVGPLQGLLQADGGAGLGVRGEGQAMEFTRFGQHLLPAPCIAVPV